MLDFLPKLPQVILFAVLLSFSAAEGGQVQENAFQGRVVGVVDGDTLDVLLAGNARMRIRLAEIDAPEKNQPWGQRAKQGLADLVFPKQVFIEKTGVDRYGRTIARVRADGVYVNSRMVEQGLAWAYRQYLTDENIAKAEAIAKSQKVGLWSDHPSQIVPPWEWRHGKSANAPPVAMTSDAGNKRCGSKRYCRQMGSCEEAIYYLHQCGVRSLDGDHDGVPCETLCRQ